MACNFFEGRYSYVMTGTDARNLYNTEHVVITVINLKPGQSLKKHITFVDVAFYVL